MIPLELRSLFVSEEEITPEVPDAFSKFLADASLAGALGRDGHGQIGRLRAASSERDSKLTLHYKKLAATAEKKSAGPAGDTLQKRFSQRDVKAPYRKYFEEEIASGKSAAQILDGWLQEFEHRNPSVEKLMREVSAEF